MEYQEFLARKLVAADPVGFEPTEPINPKLFAWQEEIVRWALRRGRAALFEGCGLGKTAQQLEWARHVRLHTGGRVLVLTPLAVARQTAAEAEKFGISLDGIVITNYEKLHHHRPEDYAGIVLDESSILKSFDGHYRNALTEFARPILYRLACTATPAPNDLIELTNHAEFLDVMRGKEIIALFFTQDGNSSSKFRLKGHAREAFWRWMASWSVAVRAPSDLGYPDDGFVLPPLRMHQHVVESEPLPGYMLALDAKTLDERRKARRGSLTDRVADCAAMVNASSEQWVVWCGLNDESVALSRAIPDAVEVTGTHSDSLKEERFLGFADGRYRVVITKASIGGWGLNWQHCHKVGLVGLSDSWEEYYQLIRRCWRFGQEYPVDCHVFTSEAEGAVVDNIERKERQAAEMMDSIVRHMRGWSLGKSGRDEMQYKRDVARGKDWTLNLGDSIDVIDEIESGSVGLCVFSPPFPGMYAYTNSARDIGNTRDFAEMIAQFRYLIARDKLLRVMMPGRTCAVHLCQAMARKGQDGFIGLKDFRGEVIRVMESEGWTYYGEVTIDKNPQVKAVRTWDSGLQFKSLATDSARMHMAPADFMIQFRAPGENSDPIRAGVSKKYDNPGGWITTEEWIRWARPVWYGADWAGEDGINETDVLNVAQARDADDERHLCPLQLGVIERAVKLWSAPDDLVFDPFNGIGSTGHEAVRLGRRYVGIELKESYWRSSIKNLKAAERMVKRQPSLFDRLADVEAEASA